MLGIHRESWGQQGQTPGTVVDVSEVHLVVSPDVRVRPMASGCVMVVGDLRPRLIGDLHERIVSVCQRPTSRSELVEVLVEAGLSDRISAESAVDELVNHGVLVDGCSGSDGRDGTRDNPIADGET